jgi:hypothetical protein
MLEPRLTKRRRAKQVLLLKEGAGSLNQRPGVQYPPSTFLTLAPFAPLATARRDPATFQNLPKTDTPGGVRKKL